MWRCCPVLCSYIYPIPCIQDFELVPRMLTKAQLTEAFRCSRFGPAGSSPTGEGSHGEPRASRPRTSEGGGGGEAVVAPQSEDLARIGIEEFVDAIGRLALMAFRFQEPAEEAPMLGFKGSYEAAAKSLWLDDTRATINAEANFPNEVSMPAAAALLDRSCIGNDDRPQMMSGAMDDMLSRTASRCFSRARSTTVGSAGRAVSHSRGGKGSAGRAVGDSSHLYLLDQILCLDLGPIYRFRYRRATFLPPRPPLLAPKNSSY